MSIFVCFSSRTVAISDYRMIKEALAESSLAGRPDMMMWHARSGDIQARGNIYCLNLFCMIQLT